MTGKETHSLDGNEVEDSNSAAASTNVPITSKEVAWQTGAATDPLTKQLGKLCDLMVELRRHMSRRSEGTYAPIQGSSGPRGGRHDMVTGNPLTTRSESRNGLMNPIMT